MRMAGLCLVGALALSTAGCATDTGKAAATTVKTAERQTGEFASDSWITTKIKTDYGFDRQIKATKINVDTAGGNVTLTGLVPSRAVAERAVRIALNTSGVKQVRSHLRFPTATGQARVFKPGEPVHF